jgi:hypothetical protein
MMAQRILFGLLRPTLGGHSRTAVALAGVLRDRGHTIDFVVGASADSGRAGSSGVTASLIHAAGFPVIPIEGEYAPSGRRSFRRNLRDLVRRNPYDALHWFESDALRDAALAAAAENRAFVWTVTSGGVPAGYCGLNRVVVYTQEVADDVRRRSPDTAVHVLPARIDLRPLDRSFVERARREIRSRLGIAESDVLIVRVARCTGHYLKSVGFGIALAERLAREGRPARFLHAGYVEDRDVALEIRRAVDRANALAGRPLAFSVTDDVEVGTRYAAAADVCIGSGRSAIEAVALQRPTMVAWGSHYLGMVDAANIEAMARTNFQGRNTREIVSDEDIITEMHDAVRSRLGEPEQGALTHELCARLIWERYSVEHAAATYERLYADRMVTVESFLTHYSNTRNLGRELYYRLPPSIRFTRAVSFLRRARLWPGMPAER